MSKYILIAITPISEENEIKSTLTKKNFNLFDFRIDMLLAQTRLFIMENTMSAVYKHLSILPVFCISKS